MEVVTKAIQAVLHPTISHALDDLLAEYVKKNFQLRFWDDSTWGAQEHPDFTLALKHPEALGRLFTSATELSLGEAYIAGEFDIEGDMQAAFDLGDYLLSRKHKDGFSQALLSLLHKLPSHAERVGRLRTSRLEGALHSRQRDLEAIRYHYDLPPEFFKLWLDHHMMYSCGYFAEGENSDLEAAQESKLEYVCKKLRLQPGERLLDIGCGWGGFLVYAASNYGVQAQGITLSVQQARTARDRIHDAGLDGQCSVVVCDYRDLELTRPFDKIVSIGMFEHVGQVLLAEYFQRVWQLLRPGGAFLNSGIASFPSLVRRRGPSFVDHYVFPDGELVPLHISIGAAEAAGFEVRDVESLREHYAMTLHEWVKRLEARANKVRSITDEATYRTWRLYMAGSEHQFRSGALNLYHMLLSKPREGSTGMPLTRADWY